MQNDKNQYGFTAIKVLLIAVAVVAVLIIIILVGVMSNVSQNKEQDQNSVIKGNLAIVLTNSMIYFDKNASYKDFCKDKYFTGPSADISNDGGSAICNVKSDNKSWCACTTLKVTANEPTGSTFCIDYRGYKRVTQNTGGCQARCSLDGICTD